MNEFLNSIVILPDYQYYYSFLFIYFVILSFPCSIILALIALSEIFVIIQHLFWCWVTLLLALDNFLYFISFLSHPFIRICSKSVYRNILQYVWYWLNLNGSMLFYCFKHYFNDISMVTLFEHKFYCIFSSRFFIVVDFTLRMASSKWKPNIHSLCHDLEMLKFSVILAVIKHNMLVFRKC